MLNKISKTAMHGGNIPLFNAASLVRKTIRFCRLATRHHSDAVISLKNSDATTSFSAVQHGCDKIMLGNGLNLFLSADREVFTALVDFFFLPRHISIPSCMYF